MIRKKVKMSVALVKTSQRLLTITVCGSTTSWSGVGSGDEGVQSIPQQELLVKPDGYLPSIKYELF